MSSNIAIICLTGTVSVNLFCDISTEAQRGKWVLVFFLVTRFLSLIYLMMFSLLCLWLECKKGRQVKFPFFSPGEKKHVFGRRKNIFPPQIISPDEKKRR